MVIQDQSTVSWKRMWRMVRRGEKTDKGATREISQHGKGRKRNLLFTYLTLPLVFQSLKCL